MSAPARPRPAALGAVDRRPPRRRAHRRGGQGAPLHGRRHRRRGAGLALMLDPDAGGAAARAATAGSRRRSPAGRELLVDGVARPRHAGAGLADAASAARRDPRRGPACWRSGARALRAASHSLLAAPREPSLNEPISLATAPRPARGAPLADLRAIKERRTARRSTTSVLAAAAGGIRRFLRRRRRGSRAAQGDGAGERPRAGAARRARQPDLVRVRRSCRATSPIRCAGCSGCGRRWASARRGGEPEGAERDARRGGVRAAHGPARAVAPGREPAHVQPRRVEHPGPAGAALHARLQARGGLPGRAARGAATRVSIGHDDRRATGVLRRSTPTPRRSPTPTCWPSRSPRRSTSCSRAARAPARADRAAG